MFEQDNMDNILSVLDKGGLILYPTDTIWGIGCDACNEMAINRIYALKRRSPETDLVVLVDSMSMLKKYVRHVHPRIDTLLHYHVRPLTVVYADARNLPSNVVAQDGSISIRIAQDEFCRELIAAFGRPIIASSASVSGESAPASFGSVSSQIIQNVDYVVKHRQYDTEAREPSVLIKVDEEGELLFLRD